MYVTEFEFLARIQACRARVGYFFEEFFHLRKLHIYICRYSGELLKNKYEKGTELKGKI